MSGGISHPAAILRRGAVLVFIAIALEACGPAAVNSSAPVAGRVTPGSAPLAARIISASVLQAHLAAHQPTVLIFIATGCVSCAADVGQLRQALASYPAVQAIGIDIVPQDTPAILASFLDDQELTAAPLLWTIDTNGSLVGRYQMATLDATVGIDRHGVIAFRNPVPVNADTLATQLADLVRR
jgi:hypothetical protein